MPCNNESYYIENYRKPEKLAEKGLSPTEIADLQARADLAREKAKATSFSRTETAEQQKRRMAKAIEDAVKEWHLDQHARLQRDMDHILALGRAVVKATK